VLIVVVLVVNVIAKYFFGHAIKDNAGIVAVCCRKENYFRH